MFVRNIYEIVGNFLLWNGEYCGGLIRRMDRKEQMMTRTVRPQSCYLCAMVCHLPRCASLSARPQRTRDCMQSLNNCIFFFQGDSLITVCKYRSGEQMISVCEIGDPYLHVVILRTIKS